jgi:hypothetical protein
VNKRVTKGGENSTGRIHFRVTPQEYDRIAGLAWYLGVRYSDLFREYSEQLRKALVDQGKRPPLHPPEDGALTQRRRVQITVSVSVEED